MLLSETIGEWGWGELTCALRNWISPGSFFTIWYPSFLLALNNFGNANH